MAVPAAAAVLSKVSIAAEVPPEARANGVVLAVVAVAVDRVAEGAANGFRVLCLEFLV